MFRPYLPILAAITLCACGAKQSFQTDPFCPSCIEEACKSSVKNDAFQTHFASLSDEDKAQMTALIEAVDGCYENQPWTREFADNAYKSFGRALFDESRPMHRETVLRAFNEVLENGENTHAALDYLMHHALEWKDQSWASEKIQQLKEHAENDDVFPLLVRIADQEYLAVLAGFEPNPVRNSALMFRWHDLPEETKNQALSAAVSAQWYLQRSGSVQLPQYLVLDWKKFPLPQGVPDFIATINVDTVKIQNNEVKKGDWYAKNAFQTPPLREPNARHTRVDLSPWLSSADTYRIIANATLELWPENTPDNCLNHVDSCEIEPVYSTPVELNRSYRVFIGVESVAPSRVKNDKENKPTSQALSLDICSEETCMPLWKDGAKTKDRSTKLEIHQGRDFYLTATAENADLPIASRLMARAGDGKPWHEIARFFTYAPSDYTIPSRADIALGELCGKIGACKLELQLRPSVRMAKNDPKISKYWGSTIELGVVTLDMQNQTPEQLTR